MGERDLPRRVLRAAILLATCFVLPSSFNLDGSVSWRWRAYELIARGNNLTNSQAFASGDASGGTSYYFVVPPRNLFLTAKATF